MKKWVKWALALASSIICSTLAYSSILNSNDNPTTFLGPTLRGSYTSSFTENTAYSINGEAAPRNFRVGATIGFRIWDNQRFKISGDYLWQRVNYSFFSGNTLRWVNQGSVGADYEYLLDTFWLRPAADLSVYYAHANNKNLGTVTGTFTNFGGVVTNFANYRRIAGSNAWGISPAVSVHPWCGARAGIALNYDNVNYDTHWSGNHDAKGFGGTVKLNQSIYDNVSFSLLGAWRQPFNNYAADIAVSNLPFLWFMDHRTRWWLCRW